MIEIDGKKYYTWDEIRAMSLGTKIKLSSWDRNCFIFFRREDCGAIVLVDEDEDVMNLTDFDHDLLYQDRFEIYEEEREYVTGCQALEKLINGEWDKIACDHEGFLSRYITIGMDIKIFENEKDHSCSDVMDLEPELLKLKKWYEYKV